jgi:CRISPR-associated protein Cas1
MQLIINSPGTILKRRQGMFFLKNKDRQVEVSPLKVQSILVCHAGALTAGALELAYNHNIDVLVLNKFGDPIGRFWLARFGSIASIRRRQLELSETVDGLRWIREWSMQKLRNQINFLKKLQHTRPDQEELFCTPIERMESGYEHLQKIDGELEQRRGTIMGIEGAAGKEYFGCLSKIMPQKFQFEGRSRRPSKDAFNAALNYGYGMLYGLVEKACILAGLDPYLGFLHTDNYNKKSLVFDFIEPFRIWIDEPVVYLFTGRKMNDDYFDSGSSGVSLNEKGKPVVVTAVNAFGDESIRHAGRNLKRRAVLQLEAHAFAQTLLKNQPLSDDELRDLDKTLEV